MNRRGFLGTMLAAAVAPAIVRAQSLMPVRNIALPAAPSSSAAVMDYWLERGYEGGHLLDAARYGIGIIELMNRSGELLATMPLHGDLSGSGILRVDSTKFMRSGTIDKCFARLPQGVFDIEFAGRGTKVYAGDSATCEAGLRIAVDKLTAL